MSENNTNNVLVMVDIQPGFNDSCHELILDVVDKINHGNQLVICFYAGKTMDCDSKDSVIAYYLENGMDMDKIDQIRFIEKRWGWFRDWTDRNVPDAVTVKAVEHLLKTGKESTEDFSDTDWQKVIGNNPAWQFVEFEDPLYAPDFNGKIFSKAEVDNIELIGGGYNECLKEINIYLQALDKNVTINEQLCYGKDSLKNKKKKKFA
jgi:hypothetical protein